MLLIIGIDVNNRNIVNNNMNNKSYNEDCNNLIKRIKCTIVSNNSICNPA